jgi:hypothetical protein
LDNRPKPVADFHQQIALDEEALARADGIIRSTGRENAGAAPVRSGTYESTGAITSAAANGPSASPPIAPAPMRVSSAPRPPKLVDGGSGWRPPRIQTAPSGPLTYAFPFPEASCSRVRAEMLRADRDFTHDEQSRVLTYAERRALAIRWICRILAVFADEACDLARSGAADWSLAWTEVHVSEVLRLLALQAERSKFVGGNKPDLTDGQGYVREEVHAEITRSPEWTEYQDKLVDLLDQSADSHPNIIPGRRQTRETTVDAEGDLPKRSHDTPFGRNLDRLRQESGWSFDELAKVTEPDKKLILGHVNKGKNAQPSTLANYARTFTEKLGRLVTVAELLG